ncbi:uncharacterized protein G2W53_018661 [Senna tora]|uniref:Uncharacterized protein n=1 Tax=Senna tora TaxID=362788 RepID=A0A834WLI7_9FABA|nr:uncharacterized protein G2W53_018661 [Senna tora]
MRVKRTYRERVSQGGEEVIIPLETEDLDILESKSRVVPSSTSSWLRFSKCALSPTLLAT